MTGSGTPADRLDALTATAMVVSQVVGVGIFLSPATMMRTVGGGGALAVWAVMGLLSTAGALCYAELATRFPRAGGAYVFLREAFGPRWAFLHGWMTLLVVDPGLTAALGVGFAQYLLATLGGPASAVPLAAAGTIVGFGLTTLLGLRASARMMRWTAAAKLLIVAVLAGAALVRSGGIPAGAVAEAGVSPAALAASIIAAFFAFGGWWELGRMAEEIAFPRRTMPVALVGGLALVTGMYALATLAYSLGAPASAGGTDEAFVLSVGTALFGGAGGRLLSGMVVVAVAGSLAAVLLGAPRAYLAMARDGLFPGSLARMNPRRGTLPASTLLQVALAAGLALVGSFEEILGYFVPCAVFFLGLSAAAVLVLPRPGPDRAIFTAPLHPLPIVLFLAMVALVLVLFVAGQPRQTLLGAAVVLLGLPVSWLVLPRHARPGRRSLGGSSD